MTPLTLYCKSYQTDLKRVVRLAESVRQYNSDHLPFYVSVPQADLPLFQEHLAGLGVGLLADEANIRVSPLPLMWLQAVWQSRYTPKLQPRNINFVPINFRAPD